MCYGHFAHTKALSYASNPERVKRNRSLIRPIKDIFLELVPEYNNAIFDNNHINKSICMNVLEAVDVITDIDLIYLDPPYCDSHADYQSFYHLLETFTNYWKDKKFINSIRRYEPKLFSGFDKKSDFSNSLLKLFDKISTEREQESHAALAVGVIMIVLIQMLKHYIIISIIIKMSI